MNARELLARFPQIPPSIHGHAVLDALASTFGEHLATAAKPSNCSAHQMTASHRIYMKLIAPLESLRFGLLKPERIVAQLEGFIQAYRKDSAAFLAEMIPSDTASVPGGCQGPGAS